MLKFVFRVEDSETKEVLIPDAQIILADLEEEKLKAKDEADAEDLAKENEMLGGGEHFASQASHGRSKYVREKFQATGIIIYKYLDRSLSPRFGCKHIALLDKWKEDHPEWESEMEQAMDSGENPQ
jgi:hypothetical protein